MSDQLSNDLASLRIDRGAEQGRPKSPLGKVVGAGVALIALAGAYTIGAPYLEAKIFRQEVALTEISVVSPAQSSIMLTSTGYVVAEKKSKVGAKTVGRIAKLHFGEGDQVEAGALVAELDASEEESQIASSRARVATAKARSIAASAAFSEIEAQAKREAALAQVGATPKATAENLVLRAKALEESVRVADAEIAATEAELRSLLVSLGLMKVVAPISGRVVSKLAEVGELVGPQTGAILEIADFTSLIVETDVPEGRLYRAKVGAPTEIVLDAYPGKRFRGVVEEIVPRVNRAKGTVPVKVKFLDSPEEVLPDMAARVSFLEKELDQEAMKAPPKTVVPDSAITERGGAKVVFVYDREEVRQVTVTLGPPFGGGRELLEGPPPGTKLVKDPATTLSDGHRVKERLP